MVPRNYIFTLLVAAAATFCGPEDPKDRAFTNPNDPNRENHSTSQSASKKEIDNELATEVNVGTDPVIDGNDTVVACLTSDCQPPANTAFNFIKQESLDPEGCSATKSVKSVDNGTSLDIFIQTNCDERSAVFYYKMSYSGLMLTAAKNLSTECGSILGVTTFTVNRGQTTYLLSFACELPNGMNDVYIKSIGFSGTINSVQLYESTTEKIFEVAWNPEAGNFGLARRGLFQRFNADGQSVGGPVVLAQRHPLLLESINGSWVLFHTYDSKFTCSRISSIGSLLCNAKTISGNTMGVVDGNQLIQNNIYGSFESTFGYQRSAFDVTNCATSNTTATVSPFNIDSNKATNKPFRAIKLNTSYVATLHASSQNLVVSTLPISGAMSVLGESSVTSGNGLTSANILVADNRIYVTYIRNGEAVIAYSDEKVK